MPHAKYKRSQRLDPRGPFAFDIRSLGYASARSEARTVPAPANLGGGLVRIPQGSDVELDIQLEEVSDGVLVTARVTAELAGECARCLDEFTSHLEVSFQELFFAEPEEGGDDGYLLVGDVLDLEPALRDALVLDLPLSPLCSADCAGLCVECGVRLAEAEPGHSHPGDGGVWAVLKDLFPESAEGERDNAALGGEGADRSEQAESPAQDQQQAEQGRPAGNDRSREA
jgi:uncharacterized protein